jgi:hypothetical protein
MGVRRMPDSIIIPPLLWVSDHLGEHYKWEECVKSKRYCSAECPEFFMCNALTLEYEGDRSKPLIKEIKK